MLEGVDKGPGLSLVLLVVAMVLFSWRAYSGGVSSYYALADEHGYLTTAKCVATTGSFAQHHTDPYAFVGETMMQSGKDATTYYLRQPIGYPVLCAGAYLLGGADAPFAINILMGILLLGGIYVVGKELGSPLWGAVTATVVAAHPLVIYYTVMALSHIPDMAAATWMMAFVLMWRRERRGWQAGAVGLLLGAGIMIRYTNVLLLLPMGVVWAAELRGGRRRAAMVHAGIAAGCMAMMLVPLAIYQWVAFGSPFRTGYSAGGNAMSFSWGWLVEHAPAMVDILVQPGTGLNVLLIGVGIGVVVLLVKDRFTVGVLAAWGIPPLVLYTAYYGKPEHNEVLYARFALSAFVPLILLGVMWPSRVGRGRWLCRGMTAAMVLAAVAMNAINPYMKGSLKELENQMLFALSTSDLVRKNVAPGSMVIADNFMHYFLDYSGDYIIYSPEMYEQAWVAKRVADLDRLPREFDPARTRQIADLLGGKSDAALAAVLRARIQYYQQSGRAVYLVTKTTSAMDWSKTLRAHLKIVDTSALNMGVYEVNAGADATTTLAR